MSALCCHLSHSQIYEIGVFAGGSNFIGDVGATTYIAPNQLAYGGIVKWNRSPRHSFRLSVIYTKLKAEDVKSSDPRRVERGYGFINPTFEISGGMEFTFFDFNLHSGDKKSTPYIFTGLSLINYNNFYFENNNLIDEHSISSTYAIPIILGYKTTLTNHIILAAEVGARYTFSDEIDGSVPDAQWLISRHSFGNINNNDWVMFSGITLTYTFGRKPCYCDF